MRLRHFLAVLALLCATPAVAANTIDWVDAFSGATYDATRQVTPGQCVVAQFTTTNEANEMKFLYVGGLSVTIQSDADTNATGGETGSQSDLFVCTSAAAAACAAWDVLDTDGDGFGDANLLDGGTTAGSRGLDVPRAVAGWLYIDPIGTSIDANETHEVIVCAVK